MKIKLIIFITFGFFVNLTACSSNTITPVNNTICKEPRSAVCTMNYMPVCGLQSNKENKTYSNACTACSDSDVISYVENACKK